MHPREDGTDSIKKGLRCTFGFSENKVQVGGIAFRDLIEALCFGKKALAQAG
jgi:hypothetical protein